MKTVIYHNPRCSKSRQTLDIIEGKGVKVEIVEYLKNPLSADQLTDILKMLGGDPKIMIRTKEAEFKEMDVDLENATSIIKAIAKVPKLMERPIVVCGKRAVIGRPPEAVLGIID